MKTYPVKFSKRSEKAFRKAYLSWVNHDCKEFRSCTHKQCSLCSIYHKNSYYVQNSGEKVLIPSCCSPTCPVYQFTRIENCHETPADNQYYSPRVQRRYVLAYAKRIAKAGGITL